MMTLFLSAALRHCEDYVVFVLQCNIALIFTYNMQDIPKSSNFAANKNRNEKIHHTLDGDAAFVRHFVQKDALLPLHHHPE